MSNVCPSDGGLKSENAMVPDDLSTWPAEVIEFNNFAAGIIISCRISTDPSKNGHSGFLAERERAQWWRQLLD